MWGVRTREPQGRKIKIGRQDRRHQDQWWSGWSGGSSSVALVQQPRIRGVQDSRAEDQAQSGRRERRVRARMASWRSTSDDAKSGRNVRSTLRPDSRLTLCELGAPDAWGAHGAEYYFCWCVGEMVCGRNPISRDRPYIGILPSTLTLCNSYSMSRDLRHIESHSMESISSLPWVHCLIYLNLSK